MSALADLRRLLNPQSAPDTSGTVVSLHPNGRVLVRTARKTITCTTVIPVGVGDSVRVQGSLIVSKQAGAPGSLPEYRV